MTYKKLTLIIIHLDKDATVVYQSSKWYFFSLRNKIHFVFYNSFRKIQKCRNNSFSKNVHFILFMVVCVSVWLYAVCVWESVEVRETVRCPGADSTGSCEPAAGAGKTNQGLEEPQVLHLWALFSPAPKKSFYLTFLALNAMPFLSCILNQCAGFCLERVLRLDLLCSPGWVQALGPLFTSQALGLQVSLLSWASSFLL